jgi:hypothetical protein
MSKQVRPRNFVLQELVHPTLYKLYGLMCWWFLDRYYLLTLDQLHDRFGTMYINTWHWWDAGKKIGPARREDSGLRPFDSKTGSKMSDHKFGKAGDVLFAKYTAQQVRDYVLAHPDEFPYITAIETTMNGKPIGWFHFSTRNCDSIMQIKV